ncbi:metallo-beta-lactamase superfamily protein [Hydrogenivirga caldilitoris]|uniref:Metallo-beta-lactamase superfamily protein n=1 Tax=Hydrogenivirga caldilitoris TaxID=246264 RepID=A0A497XR88_9AQUI|nr:MBL fold metallo-hydrolase [Hydrogenivirga caldilitoris]RLJ70801.1 metallo-beta-lactamase superfamily protein [Hydrogenivirga caldilitoris]
MSGTKLFDSGNHKVFLFEELTPASAVQANQFLLIHNNEAMLLDPGGHKVQSKLFADMSVLIPPKQVKYVFLSHQDPDIVASINYWLMTTQAQALISKLWIRFLPHFGLDSKLEGRVVPIEDGGRKLKLGDDCELLIIPAHFIHSPGNFQVYDPCSKILFSGDLGASLGQDYVFVEDFDSHIRYMEGFHRRYMASGKVLKLWANMVRNLDIEIIAPQHGAVFRGRDLVNRFIDWVSQLECGVDLLSEKDYTLPV